MTETTEDTNPEDKRHAEKMDKVWNRAKTQAKEALDWSRRVSKVGKLKLDATRMQRNRVSLLQELGRRTYELLKEGRFDPTALDQLVSQIDDLTQKIEEQQKEMEGTAKRLGL